MQHKLIFAIFISFFSFAFTANSQKAVNSPYSRFNIGSLETVGSFRSLGMGGIGTSLRDNSSISFANPASYSSFDTISFLFDFGLDYSMVYLSDGTSKFSSDDINFHHLIMGFPIAKGWGVAVGVIPVSNGYYKMAEAVLKTDPAFDPNVGEYSSYHEGSGGFSDFIIGSGVSLNKHFSVGANMRLLFGQVNRINQFDLSDLYNVYHDNSTEKLQLGGINFDYGLQYTTSFKNDLFLNAGISLGSGKNYNSKYNHLTYRYTAYGTKDTISNVSDDATKAFIPGTLRMGISFGKKNKLTAGFDFISTKWSKSKIPGADGSTADTKSFLFGAEYIPDKFSNYSLLKRIEYRIGGHVEDNYLILGNEQIKEYGASMGIGIPMRTFSKANLFFDFTRKTGSAPNNLHTENCFTMGISLNLYDWWFRKVKYD